MSDYITYEQQLVYEAVIDERQAQDARWGEQNHPDGTGLPNDKRLADQQRELTDWSAKAGTLTFRDILAEEVLEAFAEREWPKLREELVQVAAVAVAWIESGDRRQAAIASVAA